MSIYFDNNSTTKPCEKALDAMNSCLREVYGNPSSTHVPGSLAREKLSQLRREIAASINAKEN
ncbi:MAG: aminotransferase class V-fold PLP-dependent enzyme, partial [Bacillota bacterium]